MTFLFDCLAIIVNSMQILTQIGEIVNIFGNKNHMFGKNLQICDEELDGEHDTIYSQTTFFLAFIVSHRMLERPFKQEFLRVWYLYDLL